MCISDLNKGSYEITYNAKCIYIYCSNFRQTTNFLVGEANTLAG